MNGTFEIVLVVKSKFVEAAQQDLIALCRSVRVDCKDGVCILLAHYTGNMDDFTALKENWASVGTWTDNILTR